MSIFKRLGFKSAEERAKSEIVYRIVFVSPFFELEVACCSGKWQTVHAQTGASYNGDPHTILYPMLRFKSYDDARDYAQDNLRLTSLHRPWYSRFWASPPASFMSDRISKVQGPQFTAVSVTGNLVVDVTDEDKKAA